MTAFTEPAHPMLELSEWWQSPAGAYARRWEQAQLDVMVEDAFGFRAVQIGMSELDGLRANRMPIHAYVSDLPVQSGDPSRWQAIILADAEALPFANASLDLVVLPHTLEFAADPHLVLREVERVLIPEGRVVITGFNPNSLWGLRQRALRPMLGPFLPLAGRFISLPRIKDWLRLLSFEVDRGRLGCYVPPLRSERWIERLRFMDAAGDRWWPIGGATYALAAVKRVHGMRLVGMEWKKKRRSQRAAALAGVRRASR